MPVTTPESRTVDSVHLVKSVFKARSGLHVAPKRITQLPLNCFKSSYRARKT